MGYVNSPTNPPQPNFRDVAFRRLKIVLAEVLRRSQGFLDSKRLPYVANRVCQVYFGQASPTYVASCRRILRTRLILNPKQLKHFLQTGLGTHLLRWLKPFFQVPDEQVLQDLILQLASDPEGLSVLSVLQYKSNLLQVNSDQVLVTANRVHTLLQATEKAIAAIETLATTEALTDTEENFSALPNVQQPGPFRVKQFTMLLERRQQRTLPVFCYYPEDCLNSSIPVVIQSHGLASSPEDLADYAQHLASYGYFVAAPQHMGSDVRYAQEMLAGRSPHVFAPSDFVDRPQDISALLDKLEHCNETQFEGRLNLKAVGVLGYSFGSYTAFALGGAEMGFEQLADVCGQLPNLNTSLLLQCQALELPRSSYQLQDNRVQAILAMEPLGSELLGPQGLGQIRVPILMIAGSHDLVTPFVVEQARIFLWLKSRDRYLAVMQGKSHLRDGQRLAQQLDLQIHLSPQLSQVSTAGTSMPFDRYTKALSLVFFNQYLGPNLGPNLGQSFDSTPPLTAAYAASLGHSPHNVWLISQRSSAQLRQFLQQMNHELLAELEDKK